MSDLVSDLLNIARAPSQFGSARLLPDIAEDSIAEVRKRIDRVGMSGIEIAIRRTGPDGIAIRTPARAEATVSLDDPNAKGIHMSRLFLHLQEVLDSQDLIPGTVENVLRRFVDSHQEISHSAFLAIEFEHLTRRASLLSELSAWRNYPVRVESSLKDGEFTHTLRVQLTYSSTCPCSAALSRQLIQERFQEIFSDRSTVSVDEVSAWLTTQQAIAALPHSQRSHADVTIRLTGAEKYPIDLLIDACELALGTAVQAAVKRADEQEFARLNAEQLMFCEDAARIVAQALDDVSIADDYLVRVRHLESLHPHDAIAVVTKGVKGGFEA